MHAASAAYDRRRVWPESHDTELAGTAVKAVVDALRMPPQSMLQRMRDKAPFALGKSSKDDGRLEQLQMLALKPETLWNTMQVYNETRIIVAALMMGLSLTLLFGARPTDGGAWWSPSTMHWLGSVTDWISMLAFFMYFYQLMVSFSSSRVYATVPPHRLHEFIAEVTAMNPRPDLNREDTQNLGFFVMLIGIGMQLVLRHPGPQGIVEGVLFVAVSGASFARMIFGLSWHTRILWSVAWGHHPKRFDQEPTLKRIGRCAVELADDIEAACSPDHDSSGGYGIR
jgi:hypothetical protein